MRQLAAILFADIAGYTAMMQENEILAISRRKKFREVLESTIQQNNGRVLQYYGDGALSIFASAIDCVRAAIRMQQQFREAPVVDVRIGIHSGDIIMEEESIYGDGVNLSSRIESMAVPGSVLISAKVYDDIKNIEDISTREMGYFELKNVKQPVRIYAITNDNLVVPAREDMRGKTRQTNNRLAVLPFVNMSADPENEYFSDGITEELLNALTRVDGLQVTSRTSAFAFKGKNNDIRDIAIQLNVDKILEGSVRKAGDRVRITAQLINAADGYHMWSESYDRHLTDIFEVQDEISGMIANRMRENLLPEQATVTRQPARNIDAYTAYLKGLHYMNKLTPSDLRTSIRQFEEAINLEPAYVEAYAMMATSYAHLGVTGQMLPSKAFEFVHRYADRALELNSESAESHIAKALAYMMHDWKWKEGCEALNRALEINPGLVSAYELQGMYHIVTGEIEKGLLSLEKAQALDPLSTSITQTLGNMYSFARRFDDAIKQADKLIEMYPRMRIAIELKGWATGMRDSWQEAIPYFEEVHRLTNHPLKGLMGLGFAYGKTGQHEKAMEVIAKMEQRAKEEPDSVIDADLASVWYGLGDLDKTFYHLNACVDKRMGPVSYFLEYPAYDGIKADPRYEALRKRLNL